MEKINNINRYMDHTLLKADSTLNEIKKLCKEAIKYNFYSICVNSSYVSNAKTLLNNTDVKICCVCGFPLGCSDTKTKVYEAKQACISGADEIDMVLHIGMLKSKNFDYVLNDIKQVADTVHEFNSSLKVIIETCLLTDEEKVIACELSEKAGADFVKTSTGFSTGGATLQDVKLMRRSVSENIGVKASGGIRDYKTAIAMIKAGANRLGVSASVNIMNEILK